MIDADHVPERLAETFRSEWARLVGLAMRLVGDLQAAEDVVSDVLVTALDRWPLTGIPANPAAWLTTACRNRALNHLRDAGRARDRTRALATVLAAHSDGTGENGETAEPDPDIGDDRLRLMFICCHPVLPVDSQVALTLRMLGGLTVAEIARAWYLPEATIAQRIVRAKRTLAERRIPFEEPTGAARSARVPAVADVVYLIFNEGYLASAGEDLVRPALASEAHRLAKLLAELLPDEVEPWALLALIAYPLAREAARVDGNGSLVTLEHQDRAAWDRTLIDDGNRALAHAETLARAAATTGRAAATTDRADARPPLLLIQARLAACHATAATYSDTDWATIVACYDELLASSANPVVALNRAVAVAMAIGPRSALPLLDALVNEPALARSHRVWSIRADLWQRIGDHRRAVADYDQALSLVDNAVERRYLSGARYDSETNLRSTP